METLTEPISTVEPDAVQEEKETLEEQSDKKLRELAKKLGLNLPPALGREKILHAIRVENAKKQIKAEDEARASLKEEAAKKLGIKPGAIRKLCFEEQEIEKSKKVLVKFINLEDRGDETHPGATFKFNKGETYHFTMLDGQVHVMPLCVVIEEKEDEKIYDHVLRKDVPVHRDVSVAQRCKNPIYKRVKVTNADGSESETDKIVGYKKRFEFIILGDAPQDAPFGLYEPNAERNKV